MAQQVRDGGHYNRALPPPPTTVMPAPLALSAGHLHLWSIPLDPDAQVVAALSTCLVADERDRAGRFRHEQERRRYSVARGALRRLLARYLDLDPTSIRFGYGPHGKPILASEPTGVDLQFNLSHSGDLALAAFCVGGSLGVDIEHIDRAVDADALVARFGSPGERAMLTALKPEARRHRFLELWTCKEACVKATGLGISTGLEHVDIDLSTRAPLLLGAPAGHGSAREWSLLLLEPADGVTGAVALRDARREMTSVDAPQPAPIAPGLTGQRIEIALAPRKAARTAPL